MAKGQPPFGCPAEARSAGAHRGALLSILTPEHEIDSTHKTDTSPQIVEF